MPPRTATATVGVTNKYWKYIMMYVEHSPPAVKSSSLIPTRRRVASTDTASSLSRAGAGTGFGAGAGSFASGAGAEAGGDAGADAGGGAGTGFGSGTCPVFAHRILTGVPKKMTHYG